MKENILKSVFFHSLKKRQDSTSYISSLTFYLLLSLPFSWFFLIFSFSFELSLLFLCFGRQSRNAGDDILLGVLIVARLPGRRDTRTSQQRGAKLRNHHLLSCFGSCSCSCFSPPMQFTNLGHRRRGTRRPLRETITLFFVLFCLVVSSQ